MDYLADPVSGERFAALADGVAVRYHKIDGVMPWLASLPADTPPFTLITHNGDLPATEAMWRARPACVTRWFSSNSESDNIGALPLGLANSYWRHGSIGAVRREMAIPGVERDKLVYLNFANGTNPARAEIKRWFKDREWATVRESSMPFRDYLQDLHESKVVLCPPGRGQDTHRRWEALYCGAVPLGLDGADLSALPRTADGFEAYWQARRADSHPELSMAHWRHVIGATSHPRRIIGFSLWGNLPKYCDGALENVRLAPVIYPGWEMYVWYWKSVPSAIVRGLEALGATCIPISGEGTFTDLRSGGMWRFLAAANPDLDAAIFRDADSRLNWRERAAVDEWLAGDALIHSMHDHLNHRFWPMMAGMWGCRGPILDMAGRIEDWLEHHWKWTELEKGLDQCMLTDLVWPEFRDDCLTHSSVPLRFRPYRDFPAHRATDQEHVGAIVEPPARPQPAAISTPAKPANLASCPPSAPDTPRPPRQESTERGIWRPRNQPPEFRP